MKKHLFGDDYTREHIGMGLFEAHIYWSKKRLLFNIVVGLSGLLSVIAFGGGKINIIDAFCIAIWGLVANALYCFGYVLESYAITKSKDRNKFKPYRVTLFWLGTIAYTVVNVVYAFSYYTYYTF